MLFRSALFARFNLVASLVGSVGALCAGIPVALAAGWGHSEQTGRHAAFVLYGLAGLVVLPAYRRLGDAARVREARIALARSRLIPCRLAMPAATDLKPGCALLISGTSVPQ